MKAISSIWAAIAIVSAFMLIPAGCSSPAAAENTVEMHNLQYYPASLTVSVGATVTWNNTEAAAHSVTSDAGLFDSGLFSPGDSYTFTFNSAGTYRYRCKIQAGMTGTIFVK